MFAFSIFPLFCGVFFGLILGSKQIIKVYTLQDHFLPA